MEDLHIKENLPLQNDSDAVKVLSLPASIIREPLKVFNMSTSTPRKPLTDIKQVARPKDSVNIKTSTPLGTPRPTNLHSRKLKPSSLLKKADKENVMTDRTRMGKSADSCSSSHRMDEIFEENVEEFVTKVLDQCVQDLNDEKTDISSNEKLGVEELKPTLTDICMLTETQSDDLRSQPEIEVEIESEQLECMSDEAARTDGRQELVSQFGDLSVNEDSLLGNSNYSDCSFTESTKSEEELLASYVQTPNLNICSETDSNINGKEINCFEPLEARSLGLKFQTPKPRFLEKLALRQRVNDATSSLATWVFPKEVTEHHVQIVSGNNKVKLMHDVACSPMPQSRKKLSSNDNFNDNQNKKTRDIDGYDYDKQKDISSINDHKHETKKDTLNCSFDCENATSCEVTQTNKDTNVDIELGTAECINKSLQSNYSTPHGKVMCRDFASDTNIDIFPPVAMNSVACSPISVPVCDFSVQNEVETQSVLCSPIRFENCDVSIQHEGLTAEDVRKQHPRVLANELETLRLENSRLENQVKAYEKDRKKLVVQKDLQVKFEENKAALWEMETKYSQDVDEWQTRQQALESEISVLKLELEDKISVLKLEHENEMSVLKLEHKNKVMI
ncbi:uncharacterized protein LOC132739644 [Ruditapes philippinarum]|uniref:uncharacterized protein LOC132739644 n=1 Tax=Ruditapes philippinarum TaxID=129788 RepID=UPI00295A875C|nr:uncharacterized protein LOC132739644 [Ruditapes philippinarum]